MIKTILKFRLLLFSMVTAMMGILGYKLDTSALTPYSTFLFSISLSLLGYYLLKRTYYQSSPSPGSEDLQLTTQFNNSTQIHGNQPQPIQISIFDYLKALICWFDAFKRTYIINPGLYYTGDKYDRTQPLLVTSNFFLTVFLLLINVRSHNIRLLVIDTDGINVWCSAGKGVFSNRAILEQLNRYDFSLLTDKEKISLILPKFSLAGVKLNDLRNHDIRPIIGPLYAKDLSGYLSKPPFKNRSKDKVIFGLQSRLFSWLPGLVQFLGYSTLLFGILLIIEQIWGLTAPIGLIVLIGLIVNA